MNKELLVELRSGSTTLEKHFLACQNLKQPEKELDFIVECITLCVKLFRNHDLPSFLNKLFLQWEHVLSDALYEKLFSRLEWRLERGFEYFDNNEERFEQLLTPLIICLSTNNSCYTAWFRKVFCPRVAKNSAFVLILVRYLSEQLTFDQLCVDYFPFIKCLVKQNIYAWLQDWELTYHSVGTKQFFAYIIHRVVKGNKHRRMFKGMSLAEGHDFARCIIEELEKGTVIPAYYLGYFDYYIGYDEDYVFTEDEDRNRVLHRQIEAFLNHEEDV